MTAQIPEHDTALDVLDLDREGFRYRARCTCGWRSRGWSTREATATAAAAAHATSTHPTETGLF